MHCQLYKSATRILCGDHGTQTRSSEFCDSIQLTIAVAARNCTRGVLFKPGTQVMRMSSVFAPTVGIPRFSIGLLFEKGGEVMNHIRQTYLMHQANHVAKGMLANPDKSSIP